MSNEVSTLKTETQINKYIVNEFFKEHYRPETVSKIYDARIDVSKETLLKLHTSIQDKLSNHANQGLMVKVYVKLKNKRMYEFSTWPEFYRFDFDSEITEKISIKWLFNVLVPNSEIPMKHTLTLNISSGIKPEEIFKLVIFGGVDEDDNTELAPYPIYSSVEFTDKIIADELLSIVNKWISTNDITNEECNKCLLWFKQRKQIVARWVHWTTFIVLNVAFYWLFFKNISVATENLISYIQNSLIYFAIFIFVALHSSKISETIGVSLFKNLSAYGKIHLFSLTEADKKYRNKNKVSNRNIWILLLRNLFAFILANFSAWIIEFLLNSIFLK